MIFGFIAATILGYVAIWLLNAGFGIAAGSLNFMSGLKGWVGPAFYLGPVMFFAIYCLTVVALVQKVFTLIYVIPDKVLRWIGGQHEGLGEGVSSGAGDVKGGFASGSGQAAKAGADVGAKGMEQGLGKTAENVKPEEPKEPPAVQPGGDKEGDGNGGDGEGEVEAEPE